MAERFELRYVRDHVEVFESGSFLFSADTMAEAERDLREMTA